MLFAPIPSSGQAQAQEVLPAASPALNTVAVNPFGVGGQYSASSIVLPAVVSSTTTLPVTGAGLAVNDDYPGVLVGTTIDIFPLLNDDPTLLAETLELRDPETGRILADGTVDGEGSWIRLTDDAGAHWVQFSPFDGFAGSITPMIYGVDDSAGTRHYAEITITYSTTGTTTTTTTSSTTTSSTTTLPPTGMGLAVNDDFPDVLAGTTIDVFPVANDDPSLLSETFELRDPESGRIFADGTIEGEGSWIRLTDGEGAHWARFTPFDGFVGTITPMIYWVDDVDGVRHFAEINITFSTTGTTTTSSTTTTSTTTIPASASTPATTAPSGDTDPAVGDGVLPETGNGSTTTLLAAALLALGVAFTQVARRRA